MWMDCARERRRLLTVSLAALGLMALALGAGLHDVTAQGGATVAIIDFAFEREKTNIVVGETVTWTNAGMEPHTVTADDSSFTSGDLAPGGRFSQTFTTSGSVTYRCRIHPSMTGAIVVNESGEPATDGAVTEAVPVVGVGTAAPGQSSGLALLAGVAAVICGTTALAFRRA
jgi:plastocyanin